jgi:hypothetical protein
MSTKTIAIRISISAIVYAATLAIAMVVVCAMPNRSCTFAPETSGAYATWFMAVLLTVTGFIAMGGIFCPAVLILRRLKINYFWIALPLASIVGALPLLIPCVWAENGCAPSDWYPEPIAWFAFAGFCGGSYLWFHLLRHLTLHSSGTARKRAAP